MRRLLYRNDPVTHLIRQFSCLHSVESVIQALADISDYFTVDHVVFALVVQNSNR